MIRAALIIAALCLPLAGCEPKTVPNPKPKVDISQRIRVENLPIRVERSQRVSETETVQVIIVPGYPYGKRCVVFTKGESSTMQCDEISASRQ